MKPPLALVIFNMTATTVRDDDAVTRCLLRAMEDAGVPTTRERVSAVLGFARITAVRRLLTEGLGARPADAHVRAVHDNFLERMTAFFTSDTSVHEMPGATSVFRSLKAAGLKVALDIGFSRPVVKVILDRLGWSSPGLLDATVASDEVDNGCPSPDTILEAMHRTGVAKVDSVAKVGDTPADLHQGMSAGCGRVIGIAHDTHSHAELALHPHTHLIDDLRELPGVLGLPQS